MSYCFLARTSLEISSYLVVNKNCGIEMINRGLFLCHTLLFVKPNEHHFSNAAYQTSTVRLSGNGGHLSNLVHICDTKVLISPLSSIDIHNVIKSANLIIIFRGGGLVGRGLRK